MLVPSHRSRLLLFLACLSARSAHCQNVTVGEVNPSFAEVIWDKTGAWLTEEHFQIHLTTPDASCSQNVHCTDGPCKLYLEKCGKAWSYTELTVTGNSVTSLPVFLQSDDLVTAEACQTKGCFGVEVTWEYNAVNENVTHFCVVRSPASNCTEDTAFNCTKDASTRSLYVTNLLPLWNYTFYIQACGEDGEVWDTDYWTGCFAQNTSVSNLQVVGTSPTSLSAAWDPPICFGFNFRKYYISADKEECALFDSPGTNETSYEWTALEEFQEYLVCLTTDFYVINMETAYTLPHSPSWLELSLTGDDSVLAEWEVVTYEGYSIQYMVTWGSKVHYTSNTKYTIEGYDGEEVCVAVFMQPSGSHNVTSLTRCKDTTSQDNPPDVLLIVLLSVGVPAVIAAAVGIGFALRKRQKKRAKSSATAMTDRARF